MLGILRAWKRRRLARRPFPEPWLGFLDARAPFVARLPAPTRQRFLDLLKVFVWEKHFIGAGGMEITDEVKVVIGAAAVRLVLGLDLGYYDRLTEIVVYPYVYKGRDHGGAVLGEAHAWGTVVLSWPAVLGGLGDPRDGHDVGAHEFAHVMDRADGAFDGTPELRAWAHYRPWADVMSEHFLRLRRGKRAERRTLDAYGATDEAEFFAVATESFFERPGRMRESTPDLYEELRRFYGVDPAGWEATHAAEPPRRPAEVGRNDPCPCGSGKKYKRCCLRRR